MTRQAQHVAAQRRNTNVAPLSLPRGSQPAERAQRNTARIRRVACCAPLSGERPASKPARNIRVCGRRHPPLSLRFTFTDDAITLHAADRLLAADEPLTRTEQRERDIAAAFLRDMLSNGPVASKQIEADAKANGIAQRTLWRAKADLGIVAERARTHDGRTAGWYWQLPVEGA